MEAWQENNQQITDNEELSFVKMPFSNKANTILLL